MRQDRVAIVTGASGGIGNSVATRLASLGFQVAALYHSRPPVTESNSAEGVSSYECDVSDPTRVAAVFSNVASELGAIDTLVVCAGIRRDGLLMRMTDVDWSDVLAVNLTGTFLAIRQVLPQMVRNRFGRIVVVSSVAAYIGSPGQANYAASKAGQIGLVRAVAREVGSRGITCNIVAPGPIDTEMVADLTDDQRGILSGLAVAARFGRPDEVSGLVAYLCSEEAAYITGAVMPVDSGAGMGH